MNPEDLPLRRLVVFASGLIYWVGVGIQARRVRRHIGRSPNLKPRGRREKALWFGWLMVTLGWLIQPLLVGGATTNPVLTFFPGIPPHAGFAAGLTLVVLGYAGTLWSYRAMGDAWRIGINLKEKNALIVRGPYQWVRHPIYFFQIVMLSGVALLLPTLLSLIILATHYVCARLKAWDEEKYLTKLHGEVYRDYMSHTGGLFPSGARQTTKPMIDL
jgi:protein-S-isoprenylcysteine O-methyltransferase Ste14